MFSTCVKKNICADVLRKVSEIILVLVSLTLVVNEPIRVSEVCFLASARFCLSENLCSLFLPSKPTRSMRVICQVRYCSYLPPYLTFTPFLLFGYLLRGIHIKVPVITSGFPFPSPCLLKKTKTKILHLTLDKNKRHFSFTPLTYSDLKCHENRWAGRYKNYDVSVLLY